MKAKNLVCLVAAVTLLASAGAVCAYDETGSTTSFGQGTDSIVAQDSTVVGSWAGNGNG